MAGKRKENMCAIVVRRQTDLDGIHGAAEQRKSMNHCVYEYRVGTCCARIEIGTAVLRRGRASVALGNVPVELVLKRAAKIALRARDERCVEKARGRR